MILQKFLTLCLQLLTYIVLANSDTPEDHIVTIEQGKLRGKEEKDVDKNKFLSFQGIPYAKPPKGNLRFKDPQEPDKFEDDIHNATREGQVCYSMQLGMTINGLGFKPTGNEDCLFLNVFTRQTLEKDDQQLKAVMVYIHGGGFVSGSSKRFVFGPEFLMIEDVVLVTFNYRLGALGFLNFEDPTLGASGNAALKDMVQALKWVKKNIRQFGGDPDKVTLFGESAGSSSVELLLISPLTKGLFHRVILQSGSILNPWCYGNSKPTILAKFLNFTDTDESKIFEFLQSVPESQILQAQLKIEPSMDISVIRAFAPKAETDSEVAVLPDDPRKILQSGDYTDIPMIIGYNSLEGLVVKGFEMMGTEINTKDMVPYGLGYERFSAGFNETNRKLSQLYFNSDIADANNEDASINASGDLCLVYGIYESVKCHAKKSSPLYFYRFAADTRLNVFKSLVGIKHEGVSHGDDLGYIFRVTGTTKGANGTVEDIAFRRMVRLWTNFAKTGNPTPTQDPLLEAEWKPFTMNEPNYLEIGTNKLEPKIEPPEFVRMKVLDTIFGSAVKDSQIIN